MSGIRRTLLAAAPLLAGARALPAQAARDDSAVVATVQRLFDGMSRRDTAALRALLLPGTRFVALPVDGAATPTPRVQTDSAFLRLLVARPERLLERMWTPTARVEGTIATVWTPYDFHRDGKFSHCGVDTVTLLRTAAGWQIAALVYTVQRTGCAPSPLGAPSPS
jgi:ketosteroid isomerase-like protein